VSAKSRAVIILSTGLLASLTIFWKYGRDKVKILPGFHSSQLSSETSRSHLKNSDQAIGSVTFVPPENPGDLLLLEDPKVNFSRYSHLRERLEGADPKDASLKSDLSWFVIYYLDYRPVEAMQWILERPPEGIFELAYLMGGNDIGERNSFEAINHLVDQLDGQSRFLISKGIVKGLATHDPAKAFEFLEVQEDKIGRKLLVDYTTIVHAGIVAGKVEETFQSITSHVSEEKTAGVLDYAFEWYSRTGPLDAANHLFSNFKDSQDFDLFLRTVVRQWAVKDRHGLHVWMRSIDFEERAKIDTILNEL
jgi:hypothetical protein